MAGGTLRHIRSNSEVLDRSINGLVDAVNLLLNMSVGNGLTLVRHAAGIQISLSNQVDLLRFELTATLSSGGEAAARLVFWDGDSYEITSNAITVTDSIGTFTGISGQRGWCRFMADSGKYEIIQMVC